MQTVVKVARCKRRADQTVPIQTTSAIVIRKQALGEHDQLISFYTSHVGKMKAVARSARRPGNRLTGSLDLLNYGELVYFDRPHKDLQYVNSFDLRESFSALKADLVCIAYGFYIAELIDQFSPERDSDPAIFQLIIQTLSVLQQDDSPERWVHAFELRLLSLLGFEPQLDQCVRCGYNLTTGKICVHPGLGGALCKRCGGEPVDPRLHESTDLRIRASNVPAYIHSSGPTAMPISRGSWRLMKQLQKSPWAGLKRLRISKLNAIELSHVLTGIILHHLDRPLKTLDFIDNVKAENQ